jgi:hypothetical protein
VWLPFHFLPGNGGLPAGQVPSGGFIQRLVCRPDSPVAQDMVARAVRLRDTPNALHRLGITMHVYADTWAHQGFAGVSHPVNKATDLVSDGVPDHSLMDFLSSFFVRETNPLGHGTVLGSPDRPYLVWGYTDWQGKIIERDNPADFEAAADRMCIAIQRFQLRDPAAAVPGMPQRDREVFSAMIRGLRNPDADARHASWLDEIRGGSFSFGRQELSYTAKGEGSWKHAALGTANADDGEDVLHPFSENFLSSDWKRFHDALQRHRLEVINDILPRYGILAG